MRLTKIVTDVRHQQTLRRQQPRRRRHDDFAHTQISSQLDAMHRAVAAERHQRKIGRVTPFLDCHNSQHFQHVSAGDLNHCGTCFFNADVKRTRQQRLHRCARAFDIHRHFAAQKIRGRDATKKQIGIGHGHFVAAHTIGNRPRIGACALRPDFKHAFVEPRDRAAACTHFGQINRGGTHVVAAALQDARDVDARADFLSGRLAHFALLDQAGFGSGAAHVE